MRLVVPPPVPDSVNENDCDDDSEPGCSFLVTVMEPVVVVVVLVFVIVHVGAESFAEQVPPSLAVYPLGTGDSVAVHRFWSLLTSLTVKFAGSDSEAVGSVFATVPSSQTSDTLTSAALSSEKSFRTSNVTVVVGWTAAPTRPVGGAVGCVVEG